MSESTIIENSESNIIQKPKSDLPRTLGFIIGFFGIYFLVIGLFSLLAILVIKNSSASLSELSDKDIYTLILTCTSVLFSLGAMFIGYKLIKRLDSGRKLFNIYTVIVILATFAHYTYKQSLIAKSFANMPAELAAAARGNESSATLTLFILPVLLIIIAIILNLPKMKNSLTSGT